MQRKFLHVAFRALAALKLAPRQEKILDACDIGERSGKLLHHMNHFPKEAPPQGSLPVIHKLTSAYKLWHDFVPHITKAARYTWERKIDVLFLETIEATLVAARSSREQKLPFVQRSAAKLDMLKFFLQLGWEIHMLDAKKYILLSEKLDEIGRMLGGWLKQAQRESPAKSGAPS